MTSDSVGTVVSATYAAWRRHRTIRLGAGLAYYGLVAIVPLLIISLAVSGLLVDVEEVAASVSALVADVFDLDVSDIEIDVQRELDAQLSSLGVLGLVSLVITASMLFVSLQDALDTIWESPVRVGLRSLKRRLLAIGVVLFAGIVLVVTFLVHTASEAIRDVAESEARSVRVAVDAIASLGVWMVGGIAIGLLFRYIPGRRPTWSSAVIGGIATAAAIGVASRLVTIYFERFGSQSITAAAGSLFVVLGWIFATAQVILVGAELTRTIDAGRAAADAEIEAAKAALAASSPVTPSR